MEFGHFGHPLIQLPEIDSMKVIFRISMQQWITNHLMILPTHIWIRICLFWVIPDASMPISHHLINLVIPVPRWYTCIIHITNRNNDTEYHQWKYLDNHVHDARYWSENHWLWPYQHNCRHVNTMSNFTTTDDKYDSRVIILILLPLVILIKEDTKQV